LSAARRRVLIGLLFAFALALAWFAPEPVDMVEPGARPASDVPARMVAAGDAVRVAPRLPPLRAWPARGGYEPLPENESRESPERIAKTTAAAASAAAAQAPASPPPTPKVPFRYLGSLVVDGQASLFLGSGNDTLAARTGMVLPGGWRLDSASPDRLEFTFLPTEARQSLTIAAP